MNQQQTGSAGGYGNSNFMPPQRQEMEYICAGESLRDFLAFWEETYGAQYRLWCKKRDKISRTHPLSGVRTPDHVQEADETQ